ncbi:MAG: transcriptional regulator [Leptolyngbyaceae cyanobacterium bins.302]|nr:transcriptional regulator [Leptolyngbyaceae cyanobacterium bins.302]
MTSANSQNRSSFHEYLIKSLQNPEEAAAYIEAVLEEEDPEPILLKSALLDVVEAFSKARLSPEQAELQRQKLDHVLSLHGSQAIYGLMTWLNDIGLTLSVTVQAQEATTQDD